MIVAGGAWRMVRSMSSASVSAREPRRPIAMPPAVLAALVDLHRPAHVVHWHFFQMSVANVVVIVLMLLVFVLAIVLPFPGARRPS